MRRFCLEKVGSGNVGVLYTSYKYHNRDSRHPYTWTLAWWQLLRIPSLQLLAPSLCRCFNWLFPWLWVTVSMLADDRRAWNGNKSSHNATNRYPLVLAQLKSLDSEPGCVFKTATTSNRSLTAKTWIRSMDALNALVWGGWPYAYWSGMRPTSTPSRQGYKTRWCTM